MSLVSICSSGLTPIIYLIGGRDHYSQRRATSSREKNFVQHIVSVVKRREDE